MQDISSTSTQRVEENKVEDMTPDYIAAIKELKQNSVDKADYDALRLENKKLLDAVVNGQQVEGSGSESASKETIQELRDKLFDNEDQTNLEYIQNALNLRNRLLEEGYDDPFVPQGNKIVASDADYARAEKVATVLQEMVDEADGNPNVFLNEYQRRVKENSKTNIKK